jgi:protease I
MKSAFIVLIAGIAIGIILLAYLSWEGKEKIKQLILGEEKMADVLLIVANNFQGIELDNTKTAIENLGFKTEIASSIKKPASMQGKVINADLVLENINISNYRAIVFIGGSGASVFFDNSVALDIARKSFEQGKVTAAICIAPIILANAGILQGRDATVWDSGSGEMVSQLEAHGAKFQNDAVVEDGKIITANGPDAATKFGKAIARLLKSRGG